MKPSHRGRWRHRISWFAKQTPKGSWRLWITSLLPFSAGALVGMVVVPLFHLQFAEKVDLGNTLGAGATLVAAVLINIVFAQYLSTASTDTTLLLDYLTEIKICSKKVYELSEVARSGKKFSKADCNTITAAEREVSNSVHSLEHALDCCGFNKKKIAFEDFKRRRLNLKRTITDSPYPGPYNTKQQNAISNAYRSFNDELTRIRFEIHRYR